MVYSATLAQDPAYFYLLCEHQSKVDAHIAFRLLTYIVRIMETHLKQNPKSTLPFVYPIVIYTGAPPWNASTDIFKLFGQQETLARQFLLQPYHLIDINRMDDNELRQRQWCGIVEFALKYQEVRNFAKFLEILFPWLHEIENQGSNFAKGVLRYVLDGVKTDDIVVLTEKADQYLSTSMRGDVMTLAQRFEEIGLEKGIQQGMQQGIKTASSSVLETLLQHKFQHIPEAYRQKMAQADTEQLLSWAKHTLDATTIEEIFST